MIVNYFSSLFLHHCFVIISNRVIYLRVLTTKPFEGRDLVEELHPAAQERSAMSGSQGLLSRFLMVNLGISGAFLL